MGDKKGYLMKKIHESVHVFYFCFHANFIHESIKTCMFYAFLHLVPTFIPHYVYIIMVKGLLKRTEDVDVPVLRRLWTSL